MGVTMSHRFDQDRHDPPRRTALRPLRRAGLLGVPLHLRLPEVRQLGQVRHEIADPLMIEGAVHHLDILADIDRRALRYALCADLEPGLGRVRRQFAGPRRRCG